MEKIKPSQLYALLRNMILKGEYAPGASITVSKIAKIHNSPIQKTRGVLNALAHGGYLFKKRSSYHIINWTEDQIREYFNLSHIILEMAIVLAATSGKDKLKMLIEHQNALNDNPADSDEYFQAIIDFIAALFTILEKKLPNTISHIIPLAYLRLIWVYSVESGNSGITARLVNNLISCMMNGDIKKCRKSIALYFDELAPFIDSMINTQPLIATRKTLLKSEAIDPDLNGKKLELKRSGNTSGWVEPLDQRRHRSNNFTFR